MGITLKNVSYTYQAGTPFEGPALFEVNLEIKDGSYTALVGHTGSGKSTILQLLNGLLVPTEGSVVIDDVKITSTSVNKDIKQVRRKVGLVFQFAESQIFDETILKDVAFGPQNFGVSKEDAERVAREKLTLVGISEELFERSPFELSGGQMRRVAIAGVLAMQPEVLVLDEPTAGLDPKGRFEMMEMFAQLQREKGITIVLVTHQMNDVSDYADYVIVCEKGTVVKTGTPEEVFADAAWLQEKQLGLPSTVQFVEKLKAKGFQTDARPMNLDALADLLVSHSKNGGDASAR